jgi:hypothetical protein
LGFLFSSTIVSLRSTPKVNYFFFRVHHVIVLFDDIRIVCP